MKVSSGHSETATQPPPAFMQTLKTWAGHAQDVVVQHPALAIGFATAMSLAVVAPSLDALPVAVQEVYRIVLAAGVSGLLMSLIMGLSAGMVGETKVPKTLMTTFIQRLVLLTAALELIKAAGRPLADMLQWIHAHPDGALAAVTGALLARGIVSLLPAPNTDHEAYGYGVAAAASNERRTLSVEDIRRAAVHEAGHLLSFAALPALPADLTVNVLEELRPEDGTSGYVRYTRVVRELSTESELCWVMFCALAGAEAELCLLGERSDGATADNRDWLRAASRFLASGLGEVFYEVPAGEAQIAHNRAVLNGLKASHVVELGRFFDGNRAVLADLAQTIEENKTLCCAEIRPYLDRVVLTDLIGKAWVARKDGLSVIDVTSPGPPPGETEAVR